MSNFQIRVKYDDENEGVETPSVLPIQPNLLDFWTLRQLNIWTLQPLQFDKNLKKWVPNPSDI